MYLFLALSFLTYRPVVLGFIFKRSIQDAGCDSSDQVEKSSLG